MFALRSIHKFNHSRVSPKLKSVNLPQLKFNFTSKASADNVVSTGFNHTASVDTMAPTELLNKAVQNFYLKEATDPKPFDLPPQLELSMFDPNYIKPSDEVHTASTVTFCASFAMIFIGFNVLGFSQILLLGVPGMFVGSTGLFISGVLEHCEKKNNVIPMIEYMSPSCSRLFSRVDEVHRRRKIVGLSGGDGEIKNAIIKFLRETEK
jgi:hypothetical protein